MVLKLLLNIKINDICKNLKEYHPNKRRKILIVSNGMIPDMINNKNLKPIVTELFIRHRKYIYITGKEMLPSHLAKVLKQMKSTYSPLEKALETKKKQLRIKAKSNENHGKQLVESNGLIRKEFNINRDSMALKEKKHLWNLLKKGLLNLKFFIKELILII